MRAAVMRNNGLVVDTVPDPVPAEGEVLVKTLACGICGSDLHTVRYAAKLAEMTRQSGQPVELDFSRDVYLGHEFCAEVVDLGPRTTAPVRRGDRVVSMPVLVRGDRVLAIGYSNQIPGGYGEFMLLSAPLLLPVPANLPTEHAALTEPMAVGMHAVAKARIEPADAALVVGCGPVGLAVIAALKLRAVEPIIAADFSPLRRELAARIGAHALVDPAERSAVAVLRAAAPSRPTVIFECVGAPGILGQLLREAPSAARIIVAGVCMEDDAIQPALAIDKELSIQFVFAYTPEEFSSALGALADGRIDGAPLITARVTLDGVAAAFTTLAQPHTHAKIIVDPWAVAPDAT